MECCKIKIICNAKRWDTKKHMIASADLPCQIPCDSVTKASWGSSLNYEQSVCQKMQKAERRCSFPGLYLKIAMQFDD